MSKNDKPQILPTNVTLPSAIERHKRKQDDTLPEESTNRAARSQRKRSLNDWEEPTEDQLNANGEFHDKVLAEVDERMKDYDPVALDRREIEKKLQSRGFVFVLEKPKTSSGSRCRARFCIPSEARGRSNIESGYRLKLNARTGQRTSEKPQSKKLDLFYHVSCVEQIFDLRTLLESKQLEHEGGFSYKSDGFGVALKDRFMHVAIEDWFDNNGASSDLEDYETHREAHDSWKIMYGTYLERHLVHGRSGEAGCSCGPEPEKPVYSTTHREPRLLSDVLAAVAKVKQIDGISRRWLEILSTPADETPEDGEGEGASENKGKGSLRAAEGSTPTIMKASESEMKKRRKDLLVVLRRQKQETMEKDKVQVVANETQREELNYQKVDENEETEKEVTKNQRKAKEEDEEEGSSKLNSVHDG